MEINFVPKNAIFECKFCNFKCYKKSNYEKHINTNKHIHRVNGNKEEIKEMEKNATSYSCNCGKQFKTNAGLWKHRKNCSNTYIPDNKEIKDNNIVVMLLQQNSEIMKENYDLRKEQSDIKQLILELVKNNSSNSTMNNSYNTTNSHNKAFNLNFFLNETCKNAMNITDFVDSIKLQLSDLIEVGELGYVEGISKIIVNKLNSLDETIRPIHCTDKKRETIYIKDEGEWQKDDDNKSKLRKSIKKISDKNIKLLQVFREKYPDCREHDSVLSDKYCKMVIEAMGGMGFTTTQQEEKIIKNITKVTTINKIY
jgi:hypothetical protein